MVLQLNPPIPMSTPKGSGFAHFLIDYSAEHDLYWVVFLDNSGECWTFNNRHIRAQDNITLGRKPAANSTSDNDKTTRIYSSTVFPQIKKHELGTEMADLKPSKILHMQS